MKSILKSVDSISEWGGRSVRWLFAVLVGVMTFEVFMRYAMSSPTLWAFETAVMLGATGYVIGWAYAQLHHQHVRVDVLYTKLSLRGKAIIDTVSMMIFALPILILIIVNAVNYALEAWVKKERLDLTIWYPPSGPLRTVVALGFILLTLQCLAELFRSLYILVRNKAYD